MKRLAKAGMLCAGLCAALFVASGWAMVARIRDYYSAAPPPRFFFKAASDRSFDIDGRPVTLTDELTPDGRAAVRVRYGPDEAVLAVLAPPLRNFKDLSVYEESLRLLAFAPLEAGRVEADVEKGPGVRFVVVSRNPAPGHETEQVGLVGTKLWTFETLEFKRGGGFDRHTLQFRDSRGNLPALKADPGAKVEPIEERSWQWQAALWAMPRLYASRYKYKADAFDAMGWTLPTAGFSMLGVVVGLGLVLTSRMVVRAGSPAGG